MVEEGVVLVVDEELAGGRVAHLGPCHGQGAAHVVQAVVGFVLDRCLRLLLLHVGVETAALHHESRNHPVKLGARVVTAVDVAEEIFHADRGFFRVQLDFDFAETGSQQHFRVLRSQQAAGEQHGAGGEGECLQHVC
ncbi:hypothetical protein D9M68_909560 [compost metagenome]